LVLSSLDNSVCRLLSRTVNVSCTRHVQNHGYTSNDPLVSRMLGLQLRREHICIHTVDRLINWTDVDGLVFLFLDEDCLAVHNRHDSEAYLRQGFLETAGQVPTSAFNLEAEHERTVSLTQIG